MIHSVFWVLIFSKYLLWMLLPDRYFFAMLIWLVSIFGVVFFKICQRSKLVLVRSWVFYTYLVYFAWVLFCCLFSPPGQGLAAFSYALLPVLAWVFIPASTKMSESIREFCWGVSIGGAGVLAFLVLNYGADKLSDRAEGISQMGPNTIGFLSAVGMFGAWYLGRTSQVAWERVLAFGLLFFCVSGVVLSFSKTVLVGVFGVLLVSQLSLASVRSLLWGGVGILGLCLAGGVAVWAGQDKILVYLDGVHSVSNLSGRTLLWAQIFRDISNSELLIGQGFNSSVVISLAAGYEVFGTEAFGQAHNAFVEAIINTGLIGMVLLFLVTLVSIGLLFRNVLWERFGVLRAEGYLLFSILFILLVRSVTEGSFAQPGTVDSVLLFYLVVVSLTIVRVKRPKRV